MFRSVVHRRHRHCSPLALVRPLQFIQAAVSEREEEREGKRELTIVVNASCLSLRVVLALRGRPRFIAFWLKKYIIQQLCRIVLSRVVRFEKFSASGVFDNSQRFSVLFLDLL